MPLARVCIVGAGFLINTEYTVYQSAQLLAMAWALVRYEDIRPLMAHVSDAFCTQYSYKYFYVPDSSQGLALHLPSALLGHFSKKNTCRKDQSECRYSV